MFGFLITAFKQVDKVKQGLDLIRHTYDIDYIRNAPIIIVSTSEEECGFTKLIPEYKNTCLIRLKDAPGSPNCNWFIRRNNPEVPYWSWRHEFLPARIIYSMQKGIIYADRIGITKLLHLHSDTFWRPDNLNALEKELQLLDNKYVITDLSLHEEDWTKKHKIVPPKLHWLPEGQLLNLPKCKEIGYGFAFNKIFDLDSSFKATNFGMIERLFGTYFHYCLTGIQINKWEQELSKEYFDGVEFRCERTYHGTFDHILNLSGNQPDS